MSIFQNTPHNLFLYVQKSKLLGTEKKWKKGILVCSKSQVQYLRFFALMTFEDYYFIISFFNATSEEHYR